MIFSNLFSRYNSRHSNGIGTKNKDFVPTKDSKGITLVTLVVTIVVLLILAGITITMLFGENGIIKKAQDAADATKNAQNTTMQGLQNLANELANALGENGGGSGEAPKIETKGELVPVATKYATYTDSTGTAPIPGGFCVVTGEDNTIEKGLVISDVEGDDLANSKHGNQFVWVPVPNPTDMYGISSKDPATAKKYGKLYNFSATERTKNNWTETDGVMTITSANSYREPDIVTGSDGTKYDNVASYYTNAGITDKEGNAITTADQFKALLQSEFDDMIASVEKYKGFYIGRYETGDLNQTKAVVKKNNSNTGNQNWYVQYQKSKGILSEENQKNATTSMIWGCQWDATLTWMYNSTDADVKKFVTDSTGKGNYTGTQSGGDAPIPTGSNDEYSVNHIYDMARKCI